ncbi:MAG: alpha/beta fold hydrolase [Chlorobiaceae bacterium]|nr:alpha/beta fold hydrolase [Chlorobiaceae bacterium]
MLKYLGDAGGEAGTVLLLHAFPLSAAMWEPQVSALQAAGYGVVAPHVYGFDGSPSRPGWSMEEYAQDLCALLDSLGCGKVTVVGLSMGGYQAFAFWRLLAERTASIVLCDTRANADGPEALVQRQEFRKVVEKNGPAEAAARMVPNFFAPRTYGSQPELVSRVSDMILRQPAADISEAMRAIAERPDSISLLPAITCPVLCINGESDIVTPVITASDMHASIPGSKLELLPDAGHLSNLDQPDLFNRLLLAHLKSL